MSKKKHNGEKLPHQNTFDFSSLLTYCSQEEKEKFIQGMNQPCISSLMLNPENYSSNQLEDAFSDLKKDSQDNLLYRFDKAEERMGKTLEHFGGAFYILDPSSAAISYYLSPLLKKDFLSLDLCAAPGGKTIALSFRRPDGLYLANDIAYDRALEIVKNTDRLGLTNVLSLSTDPQKLSLPCMFDLIILDTPCSGSGMLRKDLRMKNDWSVEKMRRLLPLQESLLEKAYTLCKKGGIIAYSTCALSTEEDEEQVKRFLSVHKDIQPLDITPENGMVKGQNGLGYHLIPGIYPGEGIYFIFLRKTDGESYSDKEIKYKEKNIVPHTNLISYRKNAYVLTKMYEALTDLPFLSPGIKVYDDSPHPKCDFDHAYSKVSTSLPLCELSREQSLAYVQGNEINVGNDIQDGLVILTYQGLRLGLGKKVSQKIKNYLPKGLRGNLS